MEEGKKLEFMVKNDDCISLLSRSFTARKELRTYDSGKIANITEHELANYEKIVGSYKSHVEWISSVPKLYLAHAEEKKIVLEFHEKRYENDDLNDFYRLHCALEVDLAKSDSAKIGAGLQRQDLETQNEIIAKMENLIEKIRKAPKIETPEGNS